MTTITIATLTVDDENGIHTLVFNTTAEAEQSLRDNYDPENEFDGDIQSLLDGRGIVAYFDEHTVEVPDTPAKAEAAPQLFINGEPIAADRFVWDGCHKIYLIGTEADREAMVSYGWGSSDCRPIAELPQAWEDSCGLRFISWADLSLPNIVNQFDEEDGPVTIEVREPDKF